MEIVEFAYAVNCDFVYFYIKLICITMNAVYAKLSNARLSLLQ